MTNSILKINNLRTSFFTEEGEIKAVDGIDFEIEKGKALGIVGESGSGKSITSLSIMRLLQEPAGRIVDGEILFKYSNLIFILDNALSMDLLDLPNILAMSL